ncbi:MAG: hypothetical protein PUB32_03880 [Clostridiales bacterium]|nr:hypothetical protein [Clostridiales bacterium]
MSLFRPYKYKARPDLPSDAPVKHGFFLFFELFFRKFWRFITLNIYYFLVTLPMLILVYFTINGYFADQLVSESGEFIDMLPGIGIFASVVSYIPTFLHMPLVIISVILYGPATMGLTYIFRNFAREEHAWMSDFVSRGWANFKQGLFFGLLDVIVVYLLANGILAGFSIGTGEFAAVSAVILKTLSVIALIVYLFMRHYFYMIAVSVNLSVFAILKNSWYFVVLGFWRNLWAGFVCLLLTVLCFFTLPLVSLIAAPFLYYSLTGFVVVFTCYPVVKKYIIVPALEQEAAARGETVQKDEPAEISKTSETVEKNENDTL